MVSHWATRALRSRCVPNSGAPLPLPLRSRCVPSALPVKNEANQNNGSWKEYLTNQQKVYIILYPELIRKCYQNLPGSGIRK
jgi:hypothetical protein